MRTVFIIHGAYRHPGENWFPWLKENLEKQGYKVLVPKFPTPENQTLEKWLDVFSQYEVDKETILIGHSLGVPFILSLLERFKVKSCFLIAGFCTLPENQFKEGMRTFVKDFNWKQIKQNCKEFYIFQSDNDPYVPLSKAEEVAKKLGVEITTIKGAGHFNAEAGYTTFPALLQKIKEISRRIKKKIKKN